MRPVEEGLGGGRCAVPSRHGRKGGLRYGDPRRRFLRQRGNHHSGVSLRDTEPLCQCGEGAGGGIAEGAQRREEGGEEDVDPLIGLALAHPEQAPLHHLKTVRLQVGENEKQTLFRRRQGAILIHAKLAGSPEFAIEAPCHHMGLEGGLEGWHQLLKLVERQAGEIQELRGASLQVSEPYTSHRTCLLSRYCSVRGASYHKAG